MIFQRNRRIHLDSLVYIAALNGETIPAHGGISRVHLAELIFHAEDTPQPALAQTTGIFNAYSGVTLWPFEVKNDEEHSLDIYKGYMMTETSSGEEALP